MYGNWANSQWSHYPEKKANPSDCLNSDCLKLLDTGGSRLIRIWIIRSPIEITLLSPQMLIFPFNSKTQKKITWSFFFE